VSLSLTRFFLPNLRTLCDRFLQVRWFQRAGSAEVGWLGGGTVAGRLGAQAAVEAVGPGRCVGAMGGAHRGSRRSGRGRRRR